MRPAASPPEADDDASDTVDPLCSILEALPSRSVPYDQVDPFILLHEARLRLSDLANVDTRHPHRGFDTIWYVIEGSASTGHSTGLGGAMERARLREGALLALRTGRGAWHAEALGADEVGEGRGDTEFRGCMGASFAHRRG